MVLIKYHVKSSLQAIFLIKFIKKLRDDQSKYTLQSSLSNNRLQFQYGHLKLLSFWHIFFYYGRISIFALIFFTYLPESKIQKTLLSIQANSFINSLVRIQFYMSQALGKWVSLQTGISFVHVTQRYKLQHIYVYLSRC